MSVSFACYFPADNPLFLDIKIRSDVRIATLLKEIVVELHSFGRTDIMRKDLRLFKTDISEEPEESLHSRSLQWLHEQPIESQLRESRPLKLIFPDGPHPVDDMKLDIIVADDEVLEMTKTLDGPYAAFNRKVKKALNERINKLSSHPLPSDVVKSHNIIQSVFGGNEPDIHLGRPGGAPAVIFSPALAALQQRLDDIDKVPVSHADVVYRAAPYLRRAVEFYNNEEDRQAAIKEIIDSAIGKTGSWLSPINLEASQIIPNGSWWHDEFLVLVLELKNSLGLSGDALYHAIIDYSKTISRDKYKPFREYCNFPIVLVGISANRLDISVAVCVGPIYVTKLISLDLELGFHASKNIIRLARVFVALSCCRTDLEKYYRGISNKTYPELSCLFPNPTPIDSSKPLPKVTYRKFFSRTGQPTTALVDLEATTVMYLATLDGTNQEVIVKFTVQYNETAHRILAKAGFAPALHFCGRVVGDLFMVVMDRVDGMSIWQLQQDKIAIPAIVAMKVEKAVGLLHSEDIVFGDLRSNNILYVPSKDCVVLVDFDWAGKDGESRYPVTLNPSEVGKSWEEHVSAYGLMYKAHDLWQVERLKDLCT